MWIDNKKYDWKLKFFNLILLPDLKIYPSATNIIVSWTSYSDSFTPKTSHYTPEPLKYFMWIQSYETK